MGTELVFIRCPRRTTQALSPIDFWGTDHTCSYCGSLMPEEFLRLATDGCTVEPTDKNYKAYIIAPGRHHKVYFQHFGASQQDRFIDLVNMKVMKIAYPGFFYVPPYFTRPATAE